MPSHPAKSSTAPILVTGMPRSGTTWVARVLSQGGRLTYVNEPLNPQHPPGGFPGVLDARVHHRFQYICADNESEYLSAYRDLLRHRYHLRAELRRNHHPRDVPHQLDHLRRFVHGRLTGRRVLIADPYAVFSIPWFIHRLGCRVVVVVRHPRATVSSRKRLGWQFDPAGLADQPLLARDVLSPLALQLAPANLGDPVVDLGALLWTGIHRSVDHYRECGYDMVIVRHEDLSRNPDTAFPSLYAQLGLEFDSRARRATQRLTQPGNPTQVPISDPHATRLDSRANLDSWRSRLSTEEISRIDELTGQLAARFYPDTSDATHTPPSPAGE